MTRLVMVRLADVARMVEVTAGAAAILKNGDCVVLEPAVARQFADVCSRDRRPGDAVDQAVAEGSHVGQL